MTITPTGTLMNAFDSQWIGVIHQVTPRFLKGHVDETIRRRLLLAMLRKRGRIILNGGGTNMCIWNVQFQMPTPTATADGATLEFKRQTHMRQAALNWRSYTTTDMFTLGEYMVTQGSVHQIYNRYGEQLPTLMKAITDFFGGELIRDGEAAGRTNCIHGLETFLGAGSCTSSDLVAAPNDSYAGLSTELCAEGGSWSTILPANQRPNASIGNDWPNGTGSVSFDYFSPKLINTSSNRWGTDSTDWEANCERCIRQAVLWANTLGGDASKTDIILFSNDMYAGFANHQAAKQRMIIPHQESNDLGFGFTLNMEGTAIGYDYEVPPQTGYGINLDNMELVSLDSNLFGYKGPDWSLKDMAWLMMVGFYGNVRYRPKHFIKFYPYA